MIFESGMHFDFEKAKARPQLFSCCTRVSSFVSKKELMDIVEAPPSLFVCRNIRT